MDHLLTEARNPASANLDKLSSLEIVRLMNAEDARFPAAVAASVEAVARAIEEIAAKLKVGGRLVYAGAGTSGRLGVLDATECPPTFNSPPGQVIGVIAGGLTALTQAVEGAEDHPTFGEKDLQAISLTANDVVVGIATSGRTPYVLGAVDYAKRIGAFTIGLSCNEDSDLSKRVDLPLTIPVGPEILSGSTRLKAGTATKLVLNMLTTGAMILLGKTYGNLMVDLRATNEKLKARTNRIVRHLTGISVDEADALLKRCAGELKAALVTHLARTTPEAARERLQRANGRVGAVLDLLRPDQTTNPDLCIGIDGGGTKTVALLARRNVRAWTTIGRGEGGASNIQTVGAHAFEALDEAVNTAFAAAKIPRQGVACAVLGLAGAGRPGDRERIQAWAAKVGLAAKVDVLTDADLLLAAASPDGSGLAVVSGTGSIAIAKRTDGVATRAGGWGPLLGDEGSGYQVALAGLQAVTRVADGRGKPTILTERFLAELKVGTPQEIVPKVYGFMNRTDLASLAHIVVKAADAQDAVAVRIVQDAIDALALTAKAALRLADWSDAAVPIALAGGMFTALPTYGARFLQAMAKIGITPAPFTIVTEPAEGALRLAQRAAKS